MFNVTVVNIKDILRYLAGLTLTIVIIVGLARYFYADKEKIKSDSKVEFISKKTYLECLDKTIPVAIEDNTETIEEMDDSGKEKILEKLLRVELSALGVTKIKSEGNVIASENNNEETEVTLAETNLKTEVVTRNPLENKYTIQYNKVKIKNESSYELTKDMLKPDIKIKNKSILLFHTHTCESYTSSDKYKYQSTGTYRTTDLNYTVSRVGDELEKYLNKYNFKVNHDKTFHDYPAYSGSYTRSLKTVEGILEKNKDTEIVIDLHRDAIGSKNDYAPTVQIGDDYAAQLMFVIGTNGGGLWHPNWNQNLKFAIKIQEKSEELYPGLFKPIILRNSRYNQHVTKAATIIEVGATGNTLEQCLTSMKYLSKVINEVVTP